MKFCPECGAKFEVAQAFQPEHEVSQTPNLSADKTIPSVQPAPDNTFIPPPPQVNTLYPQSQIGMSDVAAPQQTVPIIDTKGHHPMDLSNQEHSSVTKKKISTSKKVFIIGGAVAVCILLILCVRFINSKNSSPEAVNTLGNGNDVGQIALQDDTIGSDSDDITMGGNDNDAMNKIVEYGNTSGNIANQGLVTMFEDRIYFCNFGLGSEIYSVNSDGSDISKINSDPSSFINVVNNTIYYSNGSDNEAIYSIRTDGSDRRKLNNEASYFINVVGDMIYYINDSGQIYSMRVDGSDRRLLNNEMSTNISVINDIIYYRNMSDGGRVYSMRTDGSDKKKLNDDFSRYINVVGDMIYYVNEGEAGTTDMTTSSGGFIYRMRIDGSDRQKLNDDWVVFINIAGDIIYYVNNNAEAGHSIYSIRTNGSDKRKLNDDMSLYINIAGDRIYYVSLFDGFTLFSIKPDGSDKRSAKIHYTDLSTEDLAALVLTDIARLVQSGLIDQYGKIYARLHESDAVRLIEMLNSEISPITVDTYYGMIALYNIEDDPWWEIRSNYGIYMGDIVYGMRHGTGYWFADDEVYIGDWVNDYPNGEVQWFSYNSLEGTFFCNSVLSTSNGIFHGMDSLVHTCIDAESCRTSMYFCTCGNNCDPSNDAACIGDISRVTSVMYNNGNPRRIRYECGRELTYDTDLYVLVSIFGFGRYG
jgi:hypothetical protein